MEYKWTVLSNTTLGTLMSSLDSNIVLIALPTIATQLRGMTTFDVLWVILGYQLVVASVLVNFGRLADMFGRVRLYNMGFAIFTAGSALCSISLSPDELIGFRLVQGIGAGFLFSNSAAIITDAFPPSERGMALGINQISIVAGSVTGLILGGILTTVLGWRSVFWVNIPIGIFATIWAYMKLRELSAPETRKSVDMAGNISFALSLVLLLLTITLEAISGLPKELTAAMLAFSFITLFFFVYIESRINDPMFDLSLFRNREFDAGNITIFLNALARGSFILVMVFFLQGPVVGLSPLQAGIFLVPMSASLSIMGPISGLLSDRFGSRAFVIIGLLTSAAGFILLTNIGPHVTEMSVLLPLILIGGGMGVFASPNRASIMNSVNPHRRGVASGISTTLVNVGNTVSIGIAFLIMSTQTSRSTLDRIFSGLSVTGSGFSELSFIRAVHLVFEISAALLLISVLFYAFGFSKRRKEDSQIPSASKR